MQNWKRFSIVLAVVALLALVWLLPQRLAPQPTAAATVIGYQTVTLFDGETIYTTTTQSAGYIAGAFGEIVLQIRNDISGTGQITVTPQFSSQPGSCTSATDWAGATVATDYVMSGTLTYGIVEINVVLVDDDVTLLRLPSNGRCLRVSIETTTTITPTIYAWMVNTQ